MIQNMSTYLKVLIFGTFMWQVTALPAQRQIMTVHGLIPTDSLGMTLIHEHVFLDWSGADMIDPSSWDTDAAQKVILPYLHEMTNKGVRSFLECTPAYLGRHPRMLKELSTSTGLQIITNTGYYAAREEKHLPAIFFDLTAQQVADIWIREFREGIEDTDVYPGFIKIGVDSKDVLTDADKKLVTAAGLTHLATGLTIVGHTGTDTTAAQQLSILQALGVDPSAFVWTHAQRGTSAGHIAAAKRGAWISLDGLGWAEPKPGNIKTLKKYGEFLLELKSQELLHQALISHDAGWYTVGETDQSRYKGYTVIFDTLIPYLNKQGFNQADWQQLLVDNPAKAYAIQIRKLTESKEN